jgi:hypothetical protein
MKLSFADYVPRAIGKEDGTYRRGKSKNSPIVDLWRIYLDCVVAHNAPKHTVNGHNEEDDVLRQAVRCGSGR